MVEEIQANYPIWCHFSSGIYFCLNNRGLPTGEAFIEMERQEDVERALEKHKQTMGKRWDSPPYNLLDIEKQGQNGLE